MARRKKSHQSHGTPNRPRFWGKHAVAAALDNPDRKVLRAWATREAAAFMQFPNSLPVTLAEAPDLAILEPELPVDAVAASAIEPEPPAVVPEPMTFEPAALEPVAASHEPVEPQVPAADDPLAAARRAQLDLLGLGDPGMGTVSDRPTGIMRCSGRWSPRRPQEGKSHGEHHLLPAAPVGVGGPDRCHCRCPEPGGGGRSALRCAGLPAVDAGQRRRGHLRLGGLTARQKVANERIGMRGPNRGEL